MDLPKLTAQIRAFAEARDWLPHHTPKNLVMAMSVEMAELLEHFQWLTPQQAEQLGRDPVRREPVEDEMADVLIYMLRLADVLGVDLERAIHAKMIKNALKHPAVPR
ncbi:nucleotide pyrophosphohydrolase [Chitiniphilus purpureus]|uniref:Nucleotide pyrophosphohydrolase n=1 Tax=Chitiniphilus purpureus TaxID=2981137 RepID=A0ABY6DKE9_9NEIS|nr:nucleotide pyrophosphohydrolase [Chitiniphilus sp. CD1]UXY14168.1 nucleotide pyrophosphohydrolase [Chitiniphilus sp. CD1]